MTEEEMRRTLVSQIEASAKDCLEGVHQKHHTFVVPPKPGWPCPSCGGLGTRADGGMSMCPKPDGSTEVTHTPATKCIWCRGKGRVNIVPIEDEKSPSALDGYIDPDLRYHHP